MSEYPDAVQDFITIPDVHMIAGSSRAGKTTFIAMLLAAVRDGRPFLGHKTNQPSALGIITTDRYWQSNHITWFERVGYPDIRRVVTLEKITPLESFRAVRDMSFSMQLLDRCLNDLNLAPGGLLVVDLFNFFMGDNLLNYGRVRAIMGRLLMISAERQLGIIGTLHGGKIKSAEGERYARLTDRFIGSQAIPGHSASFGYVATQQETTGDSSGYHDFEWATSLRPDWRVLLKRTEDGLFQIAEPEEIILAKPLNNRQTTILEAIGCQPDGAGVNDLAALFSQWAVQTIKNTLQELRHLNLVQSNGRGKWWKVPPV